MNPGLELVPGQDGIVLERGADGGGKDLIADPPDNALAYLVLTLIHSAKKRLVSNGPYGNSIGPANLRNRNNSRMSVPGNLYGHAKGALAPLILLRKGTDDRLSGGRFSHRAHRFSAQKAGCRCFIDPGAVVRCPA